MQRVMRHCFPTLRLLFLYFPLLLRAQSSPTESAPSPVHHERASRIDPRCGSHAEISFVLERQGQPCDLQAALAPESSTRACGKLVLWLSQESIPLFRYLSESGFHSMQIHYAREWFNQLSPQAQGRTDFLGNIRLEAATGLNSSADVQIPPPDAIMERTRQYLLWLTQHHPGEHWQQFLDELQQVRWDRVVLSGISHGATTAARFAKHQAVARVVLFAGPRDQLETWQRLPSATPAARIYAFSHVLDTGWTQHHYDRSWEMMGLSQLGAPVVVEDCTPPYAQSHCLLSRADVQNRADRAHSAIIPGSHAIKTSDHADLHRPVWDYLFDVKPREVKPSS